MSKIYARNLNCTINDKNAILELPLWFTKIDDFLNFTGSADRFLFTIKFDTRHENSADISEIDGLTTIRSWHWLTVNNQMPINIATKNRSGRTIAYCNGIMSSNENLLLFVLCLCGSVPLRLIFHVYILLFESTSNVLRPPSYRYLLKAWWTCCEVLVHIVFCHFSTLRMEY